MNTMPELPEPYAWIDAKEMERHKHDGEGGGIICGQYSERYGRESPLYTAAQMHTYALAAIAGREAQGGKFVGWFMTANAEGTLAFLNSLADPREVHDNGKPYYRAYAALPHPQPARGEAVNDWKQWADLERYVEEARESFLGHPSSGIFRAIGKKLSAMTTPPPPSREAKARELLERIRDVIAKADIMCLGAAGDSDGRAWPVRDEVVHDLTKAIATLTQHAEAGAVAWVDPTSLRNFQTLGHRGGEYGREWMWAKPDDGLVPVFLHPAQPASQQGEGQIGEFVIALLIAAGYVTQAKVDEARKIALSCGPYEMAAPTPPAAAQEDGIRVPREIFNHPGLVAHLTKAFDCCEEYAQEYIWEPIIRAMLTSPDSGKEGAK